MTPKKTMSNIQEIIMSVKKNGVNPNTLFISPESFMKAGVMTIKAPTEPEAILKACQWIQNSIKEREEK